MYASFPFGFEGGIWDMIVLVFTYRYIDDILYLNNSTISEFIDLIYPFELEIKDTTESNT